MKANGNNLDQLKNRNPFSVPDGYFEGLTSRIMQELPEKEDVVQPKRISMMDRVRPWLYMAAIFAGLGLFFKGIVSIDTSVTAPKELLLVKSDFTPAALSGVQLTEDEEYLEYLEDRYTEYLVADQLGDLNN